MNSMIQAWTNRRVAAVFQLSCSRISRVILGIARQQAAAAAKSVPPFTVETSKTESGRSLAAAQVSA